MLDLSDQLLVWQLGFDPPCLDPALANTSSRLLANILAALILGQQEIKSTDMSFAVEISCCIKLAMKCFSSSLKSNIRYFQEFIAFLAFLE